MSEKVAHLGFIQGVITRMNTNSFLLKGWAVALVVGISAISTSTTSSGYLILAFFSMSAFWFFDAYYLHQEKLFRKLYEALSEDKIQNIHFSMDTNVVRNLTETYCSVLFNKTIAFFYLPLLAIVVTLIYQSHFLSCIVKG